MGRKVNVTFKGQLTEMLKTKSLILSRAVMLQLEPNVKTSP